MGPDDIKRLRYLFGWSQERLARELGVSFSTVNRWEKGRSRPSPLAISTLATLGAGFSVNKRSSPRFASGLPLDFRIAGHAVSFSSVIENISSGGLMFNTAEELGPGDLLTLGFSPDSGPQRFLDADVVWVRENGGSRRVGVRFHPGL
ncbi:MAG: PilZ domain-containing protein [Deltaproteobacteria bacterium]|nr:PilZ domain-containing protein [Deltaproteobacteria bacterium]MCL4873034.1 PilZ domain-containing protein [bacterium]